MFSFVPAQPLEKGTQYEISVTTALKDEAGTPVAAARKSRFKTSD